MLNERVFSQWLRAWTIAQRIDFTKSNAHLIYLRYGPARPDCFYVSYWSSV